MKSKKLKVFHGLVNYGSQAGLIARELNKRGIDAFSVTFKDEFDRVIDVQLYRILKSDNLFLKLYKHIANYSRRLYWFFKYNTFHFYFGKTLLPNQIDLPFYKIFGKKIIMEYLGNDIRNYQFLIDRYKLPDWHEYCDKVKDHDSQVSKRIHREKKYVDYTLCCLPTHLVFAEQYEYTIDEILPLALDIENIPFDCIKDIGDRPTKILHAPTNRDFKGTEYILDAVNNLINEGYDIDFKLVENVTHDEIIREFKNCDIYIDQISVGWYGTAALEAMAVGRPTCAFIDDIYYNYIDYAEEIPVVNITKENVTNQLRNLIENLEVLPALGVRSRQFVEKYHDVKNIFPNLKNIYNEKVWKNYNKK